MLKRVVTSGTWRIAASTARAMSWLRSMDEPGGASATTSNSLMSSSTTNSSREVVSKYQPPARMPIATAKHTSRWRRHQARRASYATSIRW